MEPNTGSSERKLANAVGAKSARACDNCIKKRARWYCAADDAFLCQPCDLSVHSANPLARRHDRVRLKTSSTSSLPKLPPEDDLQKPAWLVGFTRKARTPRPNKKNNSSSSSKNESGPGSNPAHLVPEICSEDNSHDEKEEEQLLYRVPIFDPFVADMCTSNEPPINNDNNNSSNNFSTFDFGQRPISDGMGHFLPTEMDLAEFAADVESLLGNGLEHGPLNMEGLGILDCDGQERDKGSRAVKVEDEQIGEIFNNTDHQEGEFIGNGREGFVLNFDYDSPVLGEEENKEAVMNKVQGCISDNSKNISKGCGSKIFLRLDYEGVMSAWDDHKSPWTTGKRPELDFDGCWPACVGTCGTMHVYGDQMGIMMSTHATIVADGGREARVSRYREKRRTRLFSKKIRYEVRKLNAEKRPRMKGRFVKRANFITPPFTFTQ